ncbi:MAG: hypothetical protein K0U13_04050, partial [Chlamydiae bacterium]|nr:hypothetical protein [Chlamydiota bacterium]
CSLSILQRCVIGSKSDLDEKREETALVTREAIAGDSRLTRCGDNSVSASGLLPKALETKRGKDIPRCERCGS